MSRFKAEGALILTTIIWGGTFVIIKESLSYVSPMVFISSRFLFALLLLLPFIKKIFEGSSSIEFKGGMLLGFLYFTAFVTQTIGLNYTTATKSGFITGSFVMFTPIFQLIIEKRIPTKWNVIGIILVIMGLIFLSGKGDSIFDVFTEMGSNFNIGDILTLICAILYSLYIVYLDIISKKAKFMPLVFMQIAMTGIGGLLLLFILSAAGIETIKLEFNSYVISALLYTALLATIVTTILQTRFQKYVTPAKAGIIFSFEPVFAALFAYLLIRERIGNFGIIGGIFIFAGLLVSEIFDKKNWQDEKKS
jgi:drug/metabolite transporter (DMT)-like permease